MNVEYADDTLIVAIRATVNKVQERANAAFCVDSNPIRGLSLYLAIDKNQAVVFTK